MDAYVLTLFNAYVSCLRLSSSQHKKEISHIGFVICAALYVIDSVHYPFTIKSNSSLFTLQLEVIECIILSYLK